MGPGLEVPCARCGRPAEGVSPGQACARCVGSTRTYEVYVGVGRTAYARDEVRRQLRAGTLRGTAFVEERGGPVLIAGHPDFRSLFLDGHPDALPLPPPAAADPRAQAAVGGVSGARATGAPAAGRVVQQLGLLALLSLVGIGAALYTDILPFPGSEGALSAPVPVVATPPEPTTAPSPPPEVASGAAPLDALAARVGAVDEPLGELLVQAIQAEGRGTPGELALALVAAERAVVVGPEDPDALACLAAILAQTGGQAPLRDAALAKAQLVAPDAPRVARASALVALARSDLPAARRVVNACLAATPEDIRCRGAHAILRAVGSPVGTEAENLVFALDELFQTAPRSTAFARLAALVSARADLLGAEGRLAALAPEPDDFEVAEARALLALRNGKSAIAAEILKNINAPSDALLIAAAGDAVGRGDADEALALLARATPEPGDPAGAPARLYEAQARWIRARGGEAARVAEAVAAAERAAVGQRSHPALVQVRVAVATIAHDAAAVRLAWEPLSAGEGRPVDQARAWVTRAVYDLGEARPREALVALDVAILADRADPSAWLWQAQAYLAAEKPGAAVQALRSAVSAVDGRHLRRRIVGGALPVPFDAAKLQAALTASLSADPAGSKDLLFAGAAVSWLVGDTAAALSALDARGQRGADPEGQALYARLSLAKGWLAEALVAADAALAARPKEAAWHLLRGEILERLGRARDADIALGVARSGGAPASSVALVQARVAKGARNLGGALVASRAATEADPDDLVARRALRGVPEE